MASKKTVAQKRLLVRKPATPAPRTTQPVNELCERIDDMRGHAVAARERLDDAAQSAHNIVLNLRRVLAGGQEGDIAFARLIDHIGKVKKDIESVTHWLDMAIEGAVSK